jgi:UDP-3-O-[3-hydroxymyristoyl] glucosamine N-acyltransferase LpxD
MGKRLDFIRKLLKERGFSPMHYGNRMFLSGADCIIQDGVTIGLDGFGYELDEKNRYEQFPHYGQVRLGDRVHILAPTVVCRGSVRDTIIGDDTKIAGNCQIGHNTRMGKACLIGPFTCVGGSAELGNGVRTGQFVYIAHGVKIGNNVDISSFTYVSKDVPDNAKVRGIPGEIQ